MNTMALSASDPLRAAAESFIARLRRGERPTFAEYTERFPDQATRIRELFPKLLAVERRASKDQATGPFGPVEDQSHVPRAIGDFQIVREIGRGGMGIVYEAVQGSLGRQVALKILPSGPLSRGAFLERFRREARAAARLHHTNIVPVFGVGEHEGIHFYAMQYIEGLGLDSVLKEIRHRRGLVPSISDHLAKTINLNVTQSESGNLEIEDFELGPTALLPGPGEVEPTEQGPIGRGKELVELAETAGPRYYRSVARLGVQAAEALAYAHSQGVLHRDVKPSNLLLDRYGILWITDFGLAKAEGDDMTGTGEICGTLRYMAPERFQAKSDARSDVYALGMTLYEMLALRPAHEDEDRLQLLERIKHDRPPKLRTFDPSLPHDLETIVLKSIQKEPGSRYERAADLADDLRRFLSDRPIKARRASTWEELRRWCRRNPAVATLTGIGLLLVAGIIGVTIQANIAIRQERDTARDEKKIADVLRKDADDRAWEAQVATAQLHRSVRKIGQRFEALNALSDARRIRNEPLLTTYAAASLALPDLRRAQTWNGWPAGSHAVDFDDTFERYARSDKEGTVSIRWLADDSQILSLPGDGGPTRPRFSRLGGYLAVWSERDGRLRLWQRDNDDVKSVFEDSNTTFAMDFDPNDKWFASGHIDGTVWVYELPLNRPYIKIDVGGVPQAVAIRPSANEVAVAVGDEVAFYDGKSGEELDRAAFPGIVEQLAWHPDGRRYAVGCNDGSIHIAMRDGAGPSLTLEGHRGGALCFSFNHAGDLLASTGADQMLRLWDPFTGRQTFATPSAMTQPRFSRDDQHLAPEFDGNKLADLEVAVGREYRTFVRQSARAKSIVHDGSISHNGRWLALASNDGVTIWDFQTGEELAFLPLGDTIGCLFLPNGNLLTSGAQGVFDWPMRQAGETNWQLGPPRQLATWACERLACNREGNVVAAASKLQGAVILDLDRPTIRNTLMSHEHASFITMSSDGSRLATGTQTGTAVRIWDSSTNRLIRELPVAAGSTVNFSPDGRWLATNVEGEGVQLWAVDVWKKGPLLPGGRQARTAFSNDGTMIAVETGRGSIKIYRTDRESLLVELKDPGESRAEWMQFSPDGTRLCLSSNDSQAVHVWDLEELRIGLSARGLDWDAPPLERPRTVAPAATLEVMGCELLNPVLQARWTVALSSLVAVNRPDDPDLYCRRGAALVELGFNNLALADFGQALRLRPEHAEASFLRGMELFRLRQWETALDDFGRATHRPALADSARWMRGKALLQLDRVEDMLAEVNGLIQFYPNDPQLYYQRALGHAYRQNYDASMADLETALKLGPTHDPALNNMAWLLVSGPANLRDPDRALGLVQRAMKSAPMKTNYLNTYGVTLYRLGRYREASAVFERSLVAGKGQFDGYDLLFIAMCRAKMNDPEGGKQAYDRARDWQMRTRLTPHEEKELETFRKEAERVLQTRT